MKELSFDFELVDVVDILLGKLPKSYWLFSFLFCSLILLFFVENDSEKIVSQDECYSYGQLNDILRNEISPHIHSNLSLLPIHLVSNFNLGDISTLHTIASCSYDPNCQYRLRGFGDTFHFVGPKTIVSYYDLYLKSLPDSLCILKKIDSFHKDNFSIVQFTLDYCGTVIDPKFMDIIYRGKFSQLTDSLLSFLQNEPFEKSRQNFMESRNGCNRKRSLIGSGFQSKTKPFVSLNLSIIVNLCIDLRTNRVAYIDEFTSLCGFRIAGNKTTF